MTSAKSFVIGPDILKEMIARLEFFKIQPKAIVVLGFDEKYGADLIRERYPQAEIHCNNFPDGKKVDLIVSNLDLPFVADVGNLFVQWQELLNANGLLMLSSLGPDTLQELAGFPLPEFKDMHDIGDALVHARFADPVLDIERVELIYSDPNKLMEEMKVIFTEDPGPISFTQDKVELSFEIIYAHAWTVPVKPQQNPNEEIRIPLSMLKSTIKNM
jgi:malonyl-CoA O-methyltransferase